MSTDDVFEAEQFFLCCHLLPDWQAPYIHSWKTNMYASTLPNPYVNRQKDHSENTATQLGQEEEMVNKHKMKQHTWKD